MESNIYPGPLLCFLEYRINCSIRKKKKNTSAVTGFYVSFLSLSYWKLEIIFFFFFCGGWNTEEPGETPQSKAATNNIQNPRMAPGRDRTRVGDTSARQCGIPYIKATVLYNSSASTDRRFILLRCAAL